MRKLIMTTCAGGIAEVWFFDAARYEGLDCFRVIDLLNSYFGHKSVASDVFHSLSLKTVDWFAKGRYMKAVAALANALKAKPNMEGREVRRVIWSTGLKPLKEWK
jgi:hypothetical protein